eukprot:TRINITY_DN840_c0_g1_i1.p1 TRINITY_DN840_c0_g1~~TRINITY_DN840_c0_g1_i1.p1  ORF type:complete len:604 (+),score=64.70 TRINITY_DN840_c0_g1_i1:71-1813(+)
MKSPTVVVLGLFFVLVCVYGTYGKKHTYAQGEAIPVYVNTIGPYSNPIETYRYYSIPVCAPEVVEALKRTVGETLEGDIIQKSLYNISFLKNEENKPLCTKQYNQTELQTLRALILEFYYFELFCDDLPVHGFIGTVDPTLLTQPYLFQHIHFDCSYNKDRIISIEITSDSTKIVEITENMTTLVVPFTYSVSWKETSIPFEQRHYLPSQFFKQHTNIHWVAIVNSFALVILLTGFIGFIIRRVLKNDFARYNDDEQDNDYGWKLIHGDVFRFPPQTSLFCAFLGSGSQFLCITVGLLLSGLVGIFYPGSHGSLYTIAIFLYIATSFVSGMVSANFYNKMGGVKWHWNILLTASLYSVPFLLVFSYLNTVAAVNRVTTAVPIPSILALVGLWIISAIPATIIGGIAGRRMSDGTFSAPCRTKKSEREIPPVTWYRQTPVQMLMAGFLPFSAIYIELYYIYSAVWGHHSYTLYGILCLVFLILVIVTACISIALTYFQLLMEDYRWWWRSFACGGSTAIFIYLYTFFYYHRNSNMYGFLQLSFYFGYMAIICYFFFIMLGTVGFLSSLAFVRVIYKSVPVD